MDRFWIRRDRADRPRSSWTGPIAGREQADREADAWNTQRDGSWRATVEPDTPEVRAQVKAWEQSKTQPGYTRPTPRCGCACNSGGFCGGCGHAGCGGR